MTNQPNLSTSQPIPHLSDEARTRIRTQLVAHMEAHPIVATPSPYVRFLNTISPLTSSALRVPVLALVAILVVALGGATTYAAEGTLPGDTLYPLKVGVIEPARGLLAISTEAKTEWNISLAETRLEEAEQLREQNRLTPADDAQIQARFDYSLSEAHKGIATLAHYRPEAAARVDASLAVSLGAHSALLDSLESSATSTEVRAASTLTTRVREAARDAEVRRDASAALIATTTIDTMPARRERPRTLRVKLPLVPIEATSTPEPTSTPATASSTILNTATSTASTTISISPPAVVTPVVPVPAVSLPPVVSGAGGGVVPSLGL